MTNAKEIKKRIKSISNTKKITKAMEMVAAAKMRKAVEAVLRTRTYANLSWLTILNISQSSVVGSSLHPLLSDRKKINRIAIVLISSNRGLCGGFNSAIISKAVKSIKKHGDIETDFIVVGKKGLSVNSRFGCNVVADFSKADVISDSSEVSAIASMAIKEFLSGYYDKVFLAYSDFVNAVKQVPRVRQLLPIDIDSEDEYLGVVGKGEKLETSKELIKEKEEKYLKSDKNRFSFIYEPSPEEVLSQMLPRLIEVQIFQALLESNASEHSARMAAMHQATSAAEDLADELTLFYNKARQASITAEISEISAGVSSLNS
ncbi:MAG: ATP synthase F1 subunit gamma [Patescibacteria group bacterium]|jgi:F-type H+-transporting ATPase subunit gamma